MSDIDERLGRLVPPGTQPEIEELRARTRLRATRRHRLVGSVAILAVAAGSVAVWSIRDAEDAAVTEVQTTDPTPTTDDQAASIRNPVLVSDLCERPEWVVQGSEGSPPYTAAGTVHIFGQVMSPIAAQVIGDPDELPDRYAVILRMPEAEGSPRQTLGPRVIESTGVGDARVALDDGTWLSVRSRGINQADLDSLVDSIEPRPVTAEVPGVDLDATTDLQIVAEANRVSTAGWTTSTCVVDSPATAPSEIRAVVLSGSMVDVYATALDAAAPFFLRRQPDGTLLGLYGASHLLDESMLDDVVELTSPPSAD